jgi:hypothetical protein
LTSPDTRVQTEAKGPMGRKCAIRCRTPGPEPSITVRGAVSLSGRIVAVACSFHLRDCGAGPPVADLLARYQGEPSGERWSGSAAAADVLAERLRIARHRRASSVGGADAIHDLSVKIGPHRPKHALRPRRRSGAGLARLDTRSENVERRPCPVGVPRGLHRPASTPPRLTALARRAARRYVTACWHRQPASERGSRR